MKQTLLTPCPFWAEKLAATHPDDLSPFERLALQTHIDSCPTCKAVRAEYEVMGTYISQLPAVEPRPGLPPRLLQLWQERDGYPALAPAVPGDSQALPILPSTPRSMLVSPRGRVRRMKVLVQTLAAVLVMVALLGSFLALFASHHTGPGGPGPSRGWKLIPSPNPRSTQNGLYGVAIVSAGDIWAVGEASNSPLSSNGSGFTVPWVEQTLVEHWDGARWSVVPSPNAGLTHNILYGVVAVSAGDIWAVGEASNSSSDQGLRQTLIEHWNGTQWSIVPGQNPAGYSSSLSGVAVVSASDIWAVGGVYNSNTGQTLIEHWNGTRWSIEPGQNPGSSYKSLSSVSVVSASDVWAVGAFQNSGNLGAPLIEHWNGIRWSAIESPNIGGSALSSVAAVSANDVWAVGASNGGQQYGNQTLIERWNGTQWSVVKSPNNSIGYNNGLFGVAAVSANDVWAVGYSPRQYPLVGSVLIEHWNGSEWSIVKAPTPGQSSNNYLTGVARVPHSDEVWAVGFVGSSFTPARTITEVWDP